MAVKMYKRPYFNKIVKRLKEPRKFIQILYGPRQAGKTTLIQQALKELDVPSLYASADAVLNNSDVWVQQQWDIARTKYNALTNKKDFILVLDEIQKIRNWSEIIKSLWDRDSIKKINIKVVLLGSSPLLIQKGLTETLAGRFEIIMIPHWSFPEMKAAFGFTIEQYLYFGGYPGPAELINDEARWKQYIKDALIEPTISRDILMMTRIDKPSLLKNLFELGCHYSGQILSYNKILGQLQDAGNTTTLSHYLELLSSAGMLTGLQKYSPKKVLQKSSSPKFLVLNTALISAQSESNFSRAQADHRYWGRLVESAIGAYLVNLTRGTEYKLFYWREGNKEIDFIIAKGRELAALEVKSGYKKETIPGLDVFSKKNSPKKVLLIGTGGMSYKEFLSLSLDVIFS